MEMPRLEIINGIMFLDGKNMSGVYSYKIKNSATDGVMAELTLKMSVTLGKIEIESKK